MNATKIESRERLAQDRAILDSNWYHKIEFLPQVFCDGRDHGNLVITRSLLERCTVEGQKCLDIGAQDGLISILLQRRGAQRVVAYDRLNNVERIEFVKRFFDIKYDYLGGESLASLPERVREIGAHPFDIAIFSGVLYHMFDPMAGLAIVRSMVRDGGIVIIETAAIHDGEAQMHFNRAGRFYGGSNYWMISLGCLEYLCRLFRLAPIDFAYLKPRQAETGHALGRVAVACYAVPESLPTEDDTWMGRKMFRADFDDLMRFSDQSESEIPEVGYRAPTDGLVRRPDTNTVDLAATAKSMPHTPTDERRMCLMLGDRY